MFRHPTNASSIPASPRLRRHLNSNTPALIFPTPSQRQASSSIHRSWPVHTPDRRHDTPSADSRVLRGEARLWRHWRTTKAPRRSDSDPVDRRNRSNTVGYRSYGRIVLCNVQVTVEERTER
ncbi:hypothetical protein FKP32DRAFT_1597131 [Trametes sanguinea]|nr:hypothetical protein FKP32DRAFT_1597131 [Trametes sanguinea]